LRSAAGIALTTLGVVIAVIVTIVMLTLGADRTSPPHARTHVKSELSQRRTRHPNSQPAPTS
jgi:hypothetical protein